MIEKKISFTVTPAGAGVQDFIPTKIGTHLKDWIPVFTGIPGFRVSPE